MAVDRARELGAANDVHPPLPFLTHLGRPGPQLAVIKAQEVLPTPSALQAGGKVHQSSIGRTVNALQQVKAEQKRSSVPACCPCLC